MELDIGGRAENPIVSIHDQGAGGAGNVLKEIVDPLGAKIEVDKFVVGDTTLSVLEIWGAEYQEQVLFFSSFPPGLNFIAGRIADRRRRKEDFARVIRARAIACCFCWKCHRVREIN